jgi:hypothetical protein
VNDDKSEVTGSRAEAPGWPAAVGALIDSEIARWKPVVERAPMRPE